MGWSVYLKHADGKPVLVDPHREGGIVEMLPADGPTDAYVSVTYNYSALFLEFLGAGFREVLHRKRAGDLVALLERAVRQLGTERGRDYWQPTKGNAGVILALLLRWARRHPDAVFEIH